MGAGRAVCIVTPMLFTIASLVCLILIELSGWSTHNGLTGLYFFQANLTDLSVSDSAEITSALNSVKSSGALDDIYQIHLWNYCTSPGSNGTIDYCSPRKSEFYFDLVDVWQLNNTSSSTSSTIDNATSTLEQDILGESGERALNAYQTASKWMFIGYEVAFWMTVVTLAFSLLAVCSRFGSFLTWICSLIASVITLAAALTSTILFIILVEALNSALEKYGVKLTLGVSALVTTWLAVVFAWAATSFWFFSCCCASRSNPHHRSNRGGLWNAQPRSGAASGGKRYGHRYNQSYDSDLDTGYTGVYNQNRDIQQVGARAPLVPTAMPAGYQRVSSPYAPAHTHGDNDYDPDQLPLQDYAAPQDGYNGYASRRVGDEPFEPYRHV